MFLVTSGLLFKKGFVQKPHGKKKSNLLVITCHSQPACFREGRKDSSEWCKGSVLGIHIPRLFRTKEVPAEGYDEIKNFHLALLNLFFVQELMAAAMSHVEGFVQSHQDWKYNSLFSYAFTCLLQLGF